MKQYEIVEYLDGYAVIGEKYIGLIKETSKENAVKQYEQMIKNKEDMKMAVLQKVNNGIELSL